MRERVPGESGSTKPGLGENAAVVSRRGLRLDVRAGVVVAIILLAPVLAPVAPVCADGPADFLVDQLDIDSFKQTIKDLAAFRSRYWNLPGNDQAITYIKDKLESFGYTNVVLDPYTFSNVQKFNIYATKIGETRPEEMYIIGAHMDSFSRDGVENAPGADDDGSGTASVLEIARAFAQARTDVSLRFILFNNEETGLNGSFAYVANHRALQGTPDEPTWRGMIQQDMILYDHGPQPVPDADVEYDAAHWFGGEAEVLADFVAGAMSRYGAMPAEVSDQMCCTDSVRFADDIPAVSVRENRRRSEIGNGSNPNYHRATDLFETYSEADYQFGFNIVKMVGGAVAELTGARGLTMIGPTPGVAGQVNRVSVTGATPGRRIVFVYGFDPGAAHFAACSNVWLNVASPIAAGIAVADANGEAMLDRFVPESARGRAIFLQAAEPVSCLVSNVIKATFR